MSNREEFEKAYTDAFIGEELKGLECVIFVVNDSGEYLQDKVATAYAMWQARVPEGYVVVPKEPTDEMISKAQEETPHFYHGDSWYGTEEISEGQVISCYKAMIESEK